MTPAEFKAGAIFCVFAGCEGEYVMTEILIAGAGGFIGASLRYLMGLAKFFDGSPLPVSTMLVNLIGAFMIGGISALRMRLQALQAAYLQCLQDGTRFPRLPDDVPGCEF